MFKVSNPKGIVTAVLEMPPGFDPGPAPPAPPDWDERLRFKERLNKMNPGMTIEDYSTEKTEQEEKEKKIKVQRKKTGGVKSNVSGNQSGFSPNILSSYPSGYTDTAQGLGGFLSSLPSIVWIIAAVGVGIFLIRAGKRGKK